MGKRGTVNLAVAAIALIGVVRAAPSFAGKDEDLKGGGLIEAGKWAYVVPPAAPEGDHQNVLVSAPREKWVVGGGPYQSKAACEHSRTLAAIEAESQRSAARANASANPVAQAAAHTYEEQGMEAESALEKAVDEVTWRENLLAVQRKHSKCEQSDGSALFRAPQIVRPDPNAPYER